MLSVPNVSAWTGYFHNSAIKNCKIAICKNNGTSPSDAILTNDNVSSFNITSRNSYVPTELPSENCEIEIIKWQNLSSADQTYLTTRGNFLKIYYCVENVWTTNCKIVMVDKSYIDRKGLTAKITCASAFKSMTAKNTTPYWTSQFDTVETMPIDLTIAEKYQYYAIAKGKGVKVKSLSSSEQYSDQVDMLTIPTVGNYATFFYGKNIYNDFTFSIEEQDKSNIVVYGIKQDTPVSIYGGSALWSVDGYWRVTYFFPRQQVVTGVGGVGTDRQGRTTQITPTVPLRTDEIYFSYYDPNQNFASVTFGANGYDAEMEQPANNNEPYISCPALIQGSIALTNAQTAIRRYYGQNEYCEFECRIDPRLEPLDTVLIDGIGILALEEVELSFDGTFKGRMKGRRYGTIKLNNPEVDDLTYEYDEGAMTFSFSVYNPNFFDITLVLHSYDSGAEMRIDIKAYELLWFNQNNASLFTSDFVKYDAGELSNSFICRLECEGLTSSNNTIILYGD